MANDFEIGPRIIRHVFEISHGAVDHVGVWALQTGRLHHLML